MDIHPGWSLRHSRRAGIVLKGEVKRMACMEECCNGGIYMSFILAGSVLLLALLLGIFIDGGGSRRQSEKSYNVSPFGEA